MYGAVGAVSSDLPLSHPEEMPKRTHGATPKVENLSVDQSGAVSGGRRRSKRGGSKCRGSKRRGSKRGGSKRSHRRR